jgi:uncharacterized membrane protein (UPF0127 family)
MKLTLELADNSITRARGLMGRKDLPDDHGMIFIFPQKSRQGFWMQNTYLPLDIAFIDDSGKIMQISEMHPMNTRMVTSDKPCKYAVEVNQGWFKRHGISEGFQMFKEDDWVQKLKRSATTLNGGRISRFAQVPVDVEDPNIEPNELEGDLTPEQETEFGMEPEPFPEDPDMQQEQQPQEPNPVTQYNMDQAAKIQYANVNNSPMDIIYWTISGKSLPPRRLLPVPNEGYTIKSGPNGQYFTGYDSSPTIQGNGWEIKGGTPKNFTISNIISLEIVENVGETQPNEEQTIEEPQSLWDRLKNNIFNR